MGAPRAHAAHGKGKKDLPLDNGEGYLEIAEKDSASSDPQSNIFPKTIRHFRHDTIKRNFLREAPSSRRDNRPIVGIIPS